MVISSFVTEKLEIYKKLLIKWQSKINLVSRETLKDIERRHFADSLQLMDYLDCSQKLKIADIGSGAGFPGMVLAITGMFDVACVDSDRRKTLFLSEVARETNTAVTIVNTRVEEITDKKFDIITARGLAPLSKLLSFSSSLTKHGDGIFLKGKSFQSEIEEAERLFNFTYKTYPSVTDPQSVVIITKILSMDQ